MRRGAMVALVASLAGCAREGASPGALDSREACGSCRMAISDPSLAAQLVAPGEDPRFFDDIGCLRDFLAASRSLPKGTRAYVADHRTRSWVPAEAAVYTRVPAIETPMGSHLVAHAHGASRDADPAVAGGSPVPASEIFGPEGPPRGAA